MPSLWSARPETDFIWHEWEGNVVVFVTSTGATHELSPVASLALKTMLQQRGDSQPAADWYERLADDGESATDTELQAFERLLHELRFLGLVQQRAA